GRAREALERFSRRSRMGRGGRQDGEGWPARREHQQPVAGASRVFRRELRLNRRDDRRFTMSSIRMCASIVDRIRNGGRWTWIKRSAGPFAAESADNLTPPASFRNWYHVNTMVIDKGSPLFE